jgi:hypothetical protein
MQLETPLDATKIQRIDRAMHMIECAPASDLIVLPELWPTGYFAFDRYESEPEDGEGGHMTEDNPAAVRDSETCRESVRGVTHMIMGPQGFTLSVAGVFVILVGQCGYPGLLGVWLFVFGAGLAFSVLVIASGAHRESSPRPVRVVGLGLLNLAPSIVVPAAGSLSCCIPHRQLAFLIAGFTAVALYTLVLSASRRYTD